MKGLYERLVHWLQHKLLAKIMVVYLLIFAIPMLLIYSSMYKASHQTAQEDAGRQMVAALKNISDTTDEVLRSGNFIETQMQADMTFSELSFNLRSLTAEPTYQNFLLKEQIGHTLYKLYLNNPYIYSLELYNPYANVLFNSKLGETRRTEFEPLPSRVEEVVGDDFYKNRWYLQEDGERQFFASYSTPFSSNNPAQKLYARTVVSTDALRKRIREYYPGSSAAVFIQQRSGSRTLLQRADSYSQQVLPNANLLEGKEGWKSFQHRGETWMIAWYRSGSAGWHYGVSAPLTYFNSSVSVINEYLYYFILTLTVIFFISMLFLTGYIIKPMSQISWRMRQAEKGDLSVRIYTNRKDELGYIGHRFNDLMDSIDNLIYEGYESKLTKQDFELKFIQTQLKEHFIYNTLDSIHWIATRHNIPQISHIIFDLSKFFRLTLNQGRDFIAVEQVAEILRSYVSLLNVRMEDMIDCTVTVEPEIGEEQVLKYLFQPLLENSIIHGISPNHGGRIEVTFRAVSNERLCCTVRDNGTGISAAELEDIESCIEKNKSDGKYFALMNISRQLRLYFGDNYRFHIGSVQGQGTCVEMEFPRKKG
ncbi:MAG: histidine kinase [Angelakisella sp.]